MVKQPSVSARAAKLVEDIVTNADALRIDVTTGSEGERLIDMGANVVGGLEAGRRLGEVCMGGLGQVASRKPPVFPTGHSASSSLRTIPSSRALVVSTQAGRFRMKSPALCTRLRAGSRYFPGRSGSLQRSGLRRP